MKMLTGFSWMFSVSGLDWDSVELDGTADWKKTELYKKLSNIGFVFLFGLLAMALAGVSWAKYDSAGGCWN